MATRYFRSRVFSPKIKNVALRLEEGVRILGATGSGAGEPNWLAILGRDFDALTLEQKVCAEVLHCLDTRDDDLQSERETAEVDLCTQIGLELLLVGFRKFSAGFKTVIKAAYVAYAATDRRAQSSARSGKAGPGSGTKAIRTPYMTVNFADLAERFEEQRRQQQEQEQEQQQERPLARDRPAEVPDPNPVVHSGNPVQPSQGGDPGADTEEEAKVKKERRQAMSLAQHSWYYPNYEKLYEMFRTSNDDSYGIQDWENSEDLTHNIFFKARPKLLAEYFQAHGGVSRLLSILLAGAPKVPRIAPKPLVETSGDGNSVQSTDLMTEENLEVKNLCFKILVDLCYYNKKLVPQLLKMGFHDDQVSLERRRELVHFGFHSLASPALAVNSGKLLEILLARRPLPIHSTGAEMDGDHEGVEGYLDPDRPDRPDLAAGHQNRPGSPMEASPPPAPRPPQVRGVAVSDYFRLHGHCDDVGDDEDIYANVFSLGSVPHIGMVLSALQCQKTMFGFIKVWLSLWILEGRKAWWNCGQCSHRARDRDNAITIVSMKNQSLLLQVKDFLPNLITVCFGRPLRQVVANPNKWLGESLQIIDDIITRQVDMGRGMFQLDEDLKGEGKKILNWEEEMLLKVMAMQMVALLLGGSRSQAFEKRFAQLALIPRLSAIFRQLNWEKEPFFGETADFFSPDTATKIQSMRLIYSFCRHCENLDVLHNCKEWQEIKRIQVPGVLSKPFSESLALEEEEPDCVRRALGTFVPMKQLAPPREYPGQEAPKNSEVASSSASNGLLVQMVQVLSKDAVPPSYKFWMLKAIEAYLQSKPSFAEQVFLVRKGLLQSLVRDIKKNQLTEDFVALYSCLAELIKFNPDVIALLDSWTEGFVDYVLEEVSLSAMFIRAIVLSENHFLQDYPPESRAFRIASSSKLLRIISEPHNLAGIALDLMAAQIPASIYKSNCFNTLLVIFMVQRQKGNLNIFLDLMRELKTSTTNVGFDDLSAQLVNSMITWLVEPGCSCVKLETITRIPYSYWISTVRRVMYRLMTNVN